MVDGGNQGLVITVNVSDGGYFHGSGLGFRNLHVIQGFRLL
jgi:hypothetical protein